MLKKKEKEKKKREGPLEAPKAVNSDKRRRDFWLINIKVRVLWNKFHIQ